VARARLAGARQRTQAHSVRHAGRPAERAIAGPRSTRCRPVGTTRTF
jgi:hypothetical protein